MRNLEAALLLQGLVVIDDDQPLDNDDDAPADDAGGD